MKHPLSFLFLLFCTTINAQQKVTPPLTLEDHAMNGYLQKKQPAVLTITVKNAPDTITKVPIKCTYESFGTDVPFQVTKFYQLNKDGFVKIILNDKLPYQQIWLNIDHYLYAGVYANTELDVTIDAGKIKSADGFYMIGDGVEYSGTDGELNSVMNRHVLYKRNIRNRLNEKFSDLKRTKDKYSETEFLTKCDSVYQALKAIDNGFTVQYPDFKWAIENELTARYYHNLCVAYWGDKMPDSLFRKINAFSPYFVSADGLTFFYNLFAYSISKKDNPKINIDDKLYNNYSVYNNEQRSLLDSLKYYTGFPKDENEELLKGIYKKRNQLFSNEIAKIYTSDYLHLIDSIYAPAKADILKTFLLKQGAGMFDQTYPEIIKSMQTDWCRNIVSKELNQATLKQKQIDRLLAKGTKVNTDNLYIGNHLETLPFHANLYSLDTVKSVDEFIVNLRSKFPGKALVIDFWATWCSPCLEDFPLSKQLHETNKYLPIEYIYICTNSNSNMALWKKRIEGFQLSGTHIFANDQLVSELKSRLNSAESGFPTYIFIDVNGKLRSNVIQRMHQLDSEKLKSAVGL